MAALGVAGQGHLDDRNFRWPAAASTSLPEFGKSAKGEYPLVPPDHPPSADVGASAWMMEEPWVSLPYTMRPAPLTPQYANLFVKPSLQMQSTDLPGVRAMAGPAQIQLSNLVDRDEWGRQVPRGFKGYHWYYVVSSGYIMNFWDQDTLGIVLTANTRRPMRPIGWLDLRKAHQAYWQKSRSFGVDASFVVSICFIDGIFEFRVELQADAEQWVQTIMDTIIAVGLNRVRPPNQSRPWFQWAGDFYQGDDQEPYGAGWLVTSDGRWKEAEGHWARYTTMADGSQVAWAYLDQEGQGAAFKRSNASLVEELAYGGGETGPCPAGSSSLRPVEANQLDRYVLSGVTPSGAGARTEGLRRIWGDAVRSVAAGAPISSASMVSWFALYDVNTDNNLSVNELEALYTELSTVRQNELQRTLQREANLQVVDPHSKSEAEKEEFQQLAVQLSNMYNWQLERDTILRRVVYLREALDFNHNQIVSVSEFIRMAPDLLLPRAELKLEADFYSLCSRDPAAKIDADTGGCLMQ